MDRMVKCTFNGREIYLNYSVGVMFEVIEKHGDVSTALTYMQEDTKGGFEVTKHLGLLMAQDGELARRYIGHDPSPMLEESELNFHLNPVDYEAFKASVVYAISAGYGRDNAAAAKEVDVGLQALEQKKNRGKSRRAYLNYIAAAILHLSRREFYLMNPGIFYEMVQTHSRMMSSEATNKE